MQCQTNARLNIRPIISTPCNLKYNNINDNDDDNYDIDDNENNYDKNGNDDDDSKNNNDDHNDMRNEIGKKEKKRENRMG